MHVCLSMWATGNAEDKRQEQKMDRLRKNWDSVHSACSRSTVTLSLLSLSKHFRVGIFSFSKTMWWERRTEALAPQRRRVCNTLSAVAAWMAASLCQNRTSNTSWLSSNVRVCTTHTRTHKHVLKLGRKGCLLKIAGPERLALCCPSSCSWRIVCLWLFQGVRQRERKRERNLFDEGAHACLNLIFFPPRLTVATTTYVRSSWRDASSELCVTQIHAAASCRVSIHVQTLKCAVSKIWMDWHFIVHYVFSWFLPFIWQTCWFL